MRPDDIITDTLSDLSVASNNSIILYTITFFVDSGNCPDTKIAERAQDFGNGLFVSAHATDCVFQLLGVKLWERGHQSDNGVLEVPTEFALQIVD